MFPFYLLLFQFYFVTTTTLKRLDSIPIGIETILILFIFFTFFTNFQRTYKDILYL